MNTTNLVRIRLAPRASWRRSPQEGSPQPCGALTRPARGECEPKTSRNLTGRDIRGAGLNRIRTTNLMPPNPDPQQVSRSCSKAGCSPCGAHIRAFLCRPRRGGFPHRIHPAQRRHHDSRDPCDRDHGFSRPATLLTGFTRPAGSRAPWLFLGMAILSFAFGFLCLYFFQSPISSFPTTADFCWLAFYPLFIVSLTPLTGVCEP
jgi:hypothetical protein